MEATAAICPNCGAPLSEISVLALASVCQRCQTVMTKVGGTFGLTSAYGVNDPTITRTRVEADLVALRNIVSKYEGMMWAFKQKLNWGVERYAQLPTLPELLPVQPMPTFLNRLLIGLIAATASSGPVFLLLYTFSMFPVNYIVYLTHRSSGRIRSDVNVWTFCNESSHSDPVVNATETRLLLVTMLLILVLVLITWWQWVFRLILRQYFQIKAANGDRPLENERRLKAYKDAFAAALEVARLEKSAEDYRLSTQIRELEGLIETVAGKAEDVRKLLANL